VLSKWKCCGFVSFFFSTFIFFNFILLGLVNSRFELMVFPVNFEMVYRDVLKKFHINLMLEFFKN
jgi:hypothetical protein